MTNTQSDSGYYVQPMTGLFHTRADCSCGTARYGTVPAVGTRDEIVKLIAAGQVKLCKVCAS